MIYILPLKTRRFSEARSQAKPGQTQLSLWKWFEIVLTDEDWGPSYLSFTVINPPVKRWQNDSGMRSR